MTRVTAKANKLLVWAVSLYAVAHAAEPAYTVRYPMIASTYDVAGNVQAAWTISRGGTDWSAWSCQ